MEKHPLATMEGSMGHRIGMAGKLLQKTLESRFKEAGYEIEMPQWLVLLHLWGQDGWNQASLSQHLKHHKTAITRAIDKLEKQNYVLRVADRNDRRNKLIYLTNLGKSLKLELIPIAKSVLESATSGIDTAEVDVCKSVLKRIAENLADLS
ncbi:MarR family transcriptional regulator [Pontibacter sp. G13]|uniref:MarR family winged helix-turn-helix transcriptional regulator n=1 Tax=Pontibacter sp. G13 TaxID=3074898 RepID=UPI00288B4B8F|nr:MarR family transcriptional regulator [Pontibacter sp. G13]WNJ16199.1 MarR family transcriptional regulator [Pontibacter sp. G13]